MAEKKTASAPKPKRKKTGAKSDSSKPKSKSNSSPKKTSSAKAKERARQKAEIELYLRKKRILKGIAIIVFSLIMMLLYLFPGEKLWYALHQCYWGLFGFTGFLIPFINVYYAYQLIKVKSTYRFQLRILFFCLTVMMLGSTAFSFSSSGRDLLDYGTELIECFRAGSQHIGAGFVGGILGIPMTKILGSLGSGIICMLLFLLFLVASLEALLMNTFEKIKEPVSERIHENREARSRIKAHAKEVKTEQRKQAKEEYVQKKIEEIDNKTTNNEPQFRRLKRTSFYAAGTPEEQPQNQEPETPKPTAPVNDVVPDVEPKKNKKKTKSSKKSVADNFEYISEDTPVFADGLNINDLLKNNSNKKEFKDDEDLIPPVFNTDDTIPARRKGVYPISDEEKPAFYRPEPKNTAAETKSSLQPELHTITENYIKPPFTLLEPQFDENESNIAQELQTNGKILVDTLKSFGVQTTIINISRGPSVTRYELQPAAGIKISKITNLADDIAMNLAATGVRIEAPIPGKSAVGIEVPNKNISIVKMRGLVESREFQEAKSKLTVALGMDITGKITLADLSRMPHLLIAGSTGSGKSVCINSMLVSLLYKSDPDEVKLMLIDPKVVELGVYNGIPHLLVPVVTDPRKAAGALNWAVNEMLERYKTFAEYNVRDMQSYNRMVDRHLAEYEDTADYEDNERSFEEDEMLAQAQSEVSSSENPKEVSKLTKMPQIVIVIDELADLMMAAPNEVEESICRLAQMARAAGMHLVIATQRPSVDVITGLIKANVPSRIAFAVKSQIDSRTILDTGGAEKLLGRGDMLFSPIGKNKPVRVQGCYVDDTEIENIIEFIKKNKIVEYDSNVISEIEKNAIPDNNTKVSDDKDSDPMMEQAIQCVVEAGQASTSLLQRRLRLGYARAGRLIDEMEQMGIVGPHEGSKPRQVLMSYQQWLERNMTQSDNE